MKTLTMVMIALALPAMATEKHIPKNPLSPTPTIIHQSGDDHGVAGLLIGAGVTFWLMHRRARRHQPPVVTAAPPVCEDKTAEIERRVQMACAK